MAETLKQLWPNDTGLVYKRLAEIVEKDNNYPDLDALTSDAKFIYEHIEGTEIGKVIPKGY